MALTAGVRPWVHPRLHYSVMGTLEYSVLLQRTYYTRGHPDIRTKSDDKTMHTNVLFFGFSFISPLFMPGNIRKDYTPSIFER